MGFKFQMQLFALSALIHFVFFGGAKGAPILFSEIVFCVASCSYIYIYM